MDKKVQSLYDSTSRVDERVKILLENLDKLDTKFEKIIEKHMEMQTKIFLFEDKIKKFGENFDDITERIGNIEKNHLNLFSYNQGAESELKNTLKIIYSISMTIYNIALPVVVGYILYSIGISK